MHADVLILIEDSNSTVYIVAPVQNPGAPECQNLGGEKTRPRQDYLLGIIYLPHSPHTLLWFYLDMDIL